MSEHLEKPDGFSERPLYISVDVTNLMLLKSQRIPDRKERDRFIHQALTSDVAAMPGRKVGFVRADSYGLHIIVPEDGL